MHVSPAKHRYAWLPKECDYWTDTRTDRWTDRRWTKWSLCAAMLHRRHKNVFLYIFYPKRKQIQNTANSLSPAPRPEACDISEEWTTLKWTDCPNLIKVSHHPNYFLHFTCSWTTNRQMTKRADHPITRRPGAEKVLRETVCFTHFRDFYTNMGCVTV